MIHRHHIHLGIIFISSLMFSCQARITNTYNSKRENAKKEDMRQLQKDVDGSDCGFGNPAKNNIVF